MSMLQHVSSAFSCADTFYREKESREAPRVAPRSCAIDLIMKFLLNTEMGHNPVVYFVTASAVI